MAKNVLNALHILYLWKAKMNTKPQALNQVSQRKNTRSARSYTSVVAKGRLLDDVCALRYRSYLADNYIEPNDTKRFFDEYDHEANCISYLTYMNGEVVGSIRSCVFDPMVDNTVPAMEVFEDEIRENVGFNDVIVESNKFVIAPEFQRKGGITARLVLMLNIVNAALDSKAGSIITAVRAEHVRHYRLFSLEKISDAKRYPNLNFDTILLACYDVPALKNHIHSMLK